MNQKSKEQKPKLSHNPIFYLFLCLLLVSTGSAQILMWFDYFTEFPAGWTTGGSGGPWTKVSNRAKSTPNSVKCTPNANYANNQNNWMQRTIDLTGYVNASVVFSIWQNTGWNDYIYFEYFSGDSWITHWARSGDYGGFDQQVMTNIPNTATAVRFRFSSDTIGTTEGVYIDDFYLYGYRYDLGCTQIFAPTGTIDSGQVITPQARVQNFGDYITTFWVRMRIGNFYNNSVQVVNLAPGTFTTVNFPGWSAIQRGNHFVRCSTEYANDINPLNDRCTSSISVRVRDVATAAIVAPSGIIDSAQVVTPKAIINNLGTHTETFNVYFWIGNTYSSIQSVNLGPGLSDTIDFAPWTALVRGPNTLKCSTALAGDVSTSNDRQTGSAVVRVRDVGVSAIISPAGTVDSAAFLIPQAQIMNYGSHQENLSVTLYINGPGVNWSNTVTVSNLNSGEQRTVSIGSWNIGPRGNYTTRCTTALVGDQINSNDARDSSFTVRVRDVGVTSINSPPAAVDSASTVPISATVQNFGTTTETFSVLFRIGGFYTSSRTITLTPNGSSVVNFDPWLVNQTRNTYTPRCSTTLAGDANANNNRQTSSVTVNIHDVGVALINSPTTEVDSNTVSPVSARITNYGTYSETFSISFRIGSFYTSLRTITLPAGNFSVVSFDNWSVTQPRGSYAMKCSTQLNLDINPNNDALTGTVAVMVHDVGVVSLNSPPAQVDSNSTVTVSATIANYGTSNESFDVNYKIGGFYSSVISINMPPNSSQSVNFANWLVLQPRGSYTLSCSTQLSNDINRGNDRQTGTVTINVHDVGVASFTGLPASVDSGTQVPISATVANYGSTSETFDVECRIGTGYTSTRTLTLNPGSSSPVAFDTWQPLTRNNNTVKCSTRLSNDAYRNNDFQQDSIFVIVRDILASAVVAPVETIALGVQVIPKARFENIGNQPATFPVTFQISVRSNIIYFDLINLYLEPGMESVVEFAAWTPESLGMHTAQIQCVLLDDMNPTNDVRFDTIIVFTDIVWLQKQDLPIGLRNKRVKKGAALVYVPDYSIYAFKGSNTNEFYRYDILTDSWTNICSIPYSITRSKRVKDGSALCYSGEYIFALKGANTSEFWQYRITTDSWTEKKSIPEGLRGRRVKGGSGLVYVSKGDTSFIYCLKGSKTDEFYAYWVEMDTWLKRKPVPLAPSGKVLYRGSSIIYDGANHIYALKGKTNEFYVYDITLDTWEMKPMLPFYGTMGKKKKAKNGAGLAHNGANLIYALKGGNTDELWSYDIVQDTWLSKEPIPMAPSNKRVKSGGAICFATVNGKAYVFKGANTREFWAYSPFTMTLTAQNGSEDGNMSSNQIKSVAKFNLEIKPIPCNKTAEIRYNLPEPDDVRLKLYDACGKLVKILTVPANSKQGRITLNSQELPTGVYVLRLEGRNFGLVKKMVISR